MCTLLNSGSRASHIDLHSSAEDEIDKCMYICPNFMTPWDQSLTRCDRAVPVFPSKRKLSTSWSMLQDTLVWNKNHKLYLLASSISNNNITDIFWTFTNSAWNTSFKLLFLGSSAYTVYLMVNEYKPTTDPGLDTFKVQYLLGGSAVLAILFPYEYTPNEVGVLPILSLTNSIEAFLTASPTHRCSGLSRYGSSLWQFYLNSSCYNAPARQRRSQRTTSLRSEYIVHSIFLTGFTATLQMGTLTR